MTCSFICAWDVEWNTHRRIENLKKKLWKKKPFVLLEITEIYILKKTRLCYKIKSTDITNVLGPK